MAPERFPRQKYLRQLATMSDELGEWIAPYRQAADNHRDDWLGARFEGRAAVLEHALFQIRQLHDTIYGLPRLT